MLDARPLILQGTAYESFGRKICPILLNQFVTVVTQWIMCAQIHDGNSIWDRFGTMKEKGVA